ncbi:MAG: prepilin-type N-terminal cleavage/methylation domain-containing protein [Lachnospiraceae bacterium]|nr:prepilin-type N-terminal cleavage/methylation domain-containing protein [Lachnospiraceae bacterium]
MKKKLSNLKKDQNGFTLVELIVVLVILAILAALLVPALLGYIDRARNSKYLEEARSIYTALQAVNDENYANGLDHYASVAAAKDEINKLVSPTVVTSGDITYLSTDSSTDKHKYYTLKYVESLTFTSQDGSTVVVSMKTDGSGSWDTDTMTITAAKQTGNGNGTGTGGGSGSGSGN